jgi:hypothetical protein
LAVNARLARSGSRAMRTWNDISKTLVTSRDLKTRNPFRSKKSKRILIKETKTTNRMSLLTFPKTKGTIVPNLKTTTKNLSETKNNLLKRSKIRKMTRSKKRLQEMAASKVARSLNRRTLRTLPKRSSLKIISGAKNTRNR